MIYEIALRYLKKISFLDFLTLRYRNILQVFDCISLAYLKMNYKPVLLNEKKKILFSNNDERRECIVQCGEGEQVRFVRVPKV